MAIAMNLTHDPSGSAGSKVMVRVLRYALDGPPTGWS
jgi:hypothetical protein